MVWISDEPRKHFSRRTMRTAKKPYICASCGLPIEIGQQHFDVAGKNYEGFYHLRVHLGPCPKKGQE